MGLFKITKYNGEDINQWNSNYVCPVTGSDSNNGTRENPYATVTRATGDKSFTILRGKTTENLSLTFNGWRLLGENEATIKGDCVDSQYACTFINLTIQGDVYKGSWENAAIQNCTIQGVLYGYIHNAGPQGSGYNLVHVFRPYRVFKAPNNTILKFENYISENYANNSLVNSILIHSVDLYNHQTLDVLKFCTFEYCLFRKQTIWKWGNITIPITYGGDENLYLQNLKDSLYTFSETLIAEEQLYLRSLIDNAFPGTNKIVDDNIHPIFNRYSVSGEVIDYSLRLESDNRALYMSDDDSYVGCYEANVGGMVFGNTTDVDTNATDTNVTPDLLVKNASGTFYASPDSWQLWNRIQTNVLTYPRGFSFVGLQSSLKSGIDARMYFGKKQTYNVTDAPTLPFESVEVIPYDSLTEISSFPRFSASFNGSCQMWYHTSGAKANQPILFNDLLDLGITTDKDLAIYGTWGVTNADYESYLLSSVANVAARNIPIKFVKLELNLHYAE